jgi:hypothetical protein
MTLPFFYKTSVKKKKEAIQENYPTLTSLIQKTPPPEEQLEAEDIDENFFYKHITTHFHSLFLESTVVCIPHTRSIQGLVITKDVIGKQLPPFISIPLFNNNNNIRVSLLSTFSLLL